MIDGGPGPAGPPSFRRRVVKEQCPRTSRGQRSPSTRTSERAHGIRRSRAIARARSSNRSLFVGHTSACDFGKEQRLIFVNRSSSRSPLTRPSSGHVTEWLGSSMAASPPSRVPH
jgi:hypothetical protein